jgi:hypothetical protein
MRPDAPQIQPFFRQGLDLDLHRSASESRTLAAVDCFAPRAKKQGPDCSGPCFGRS